MQISENPTRHIDHLESDFLPHEIRTSLCKYLEGCHNFFDRGSHKVLTIGQPHKNISLTSEPSNIPTALSSVVDLIHRKFNISQENMLNSIEVIKFQGTDSKLAERKDPDKSISPDSNVFIITLGDSCTTTFKDCCTNSEQNVAIPDNNLYSMSLKSQYYWSHRIDHAVLSENSVGYRIAFRSMRRNNRNSTLIFGDSNTHFIHFYHEKQRSDLGKNIYGRRLKAYTIEDIEPCDCIGFQNIVVQVGLSNLKNKFASTDGRIDIAKTFDMWLNKLLQIRQLCPYSRIIVSQIPPTKIRALNERARNFNSFLFSSINKFRYPLDFNDFLDDKLDLLDSNFGRYFNVSTGRRDRIHLGKLGISKLSLLIKEAVLLPRYMVGHQSYASVTRDHTTHSSSHNT